MPPPLRLRNYTSQKGQAGMPSTTAHANIQRVCRNHFFSCSCSSLPHLVRSSNRTVRAMRENKKTHSGNEKYWRIAIYSRHGMCLAAQSTLEPLCVECALPKWKIAEKWIMYGARTRCRAKISNNHDYFWISHSIFYSHWSANIISFHQIIASYISVWFASGMTASEGAQLSTNQSFSHQSQDFFLHSFSSIQRSRSNSIRCYNL